MSDDKFHFEIPDGNIRNEKFDKRGFTKKVPRANHADHGRRLKLQTNELKKSHNSKKDSEYTNDLFLQIATPAEYSIKSQKSNVEKLGIEVLNYSLENSSIGIGKISKHSLQAFEKKLDKYIELPKHPRKSYFAPIEEITEVSVESKIEKQIDFESDRLVDIIINLYSALAAKERLAIANTIVEELREVSENIEHRSFSNGIYSIECSIQANRIPEIAQDFSTIKEIKLSKTFVVPQAVPSDPMPDPLTIEKAESNSVIAVVDSGVNNSNGILDSVVTVKEEYLPKGATSACQEHGTFVASRCVFGDNLDHHVGSNYLTPYCKICDVTVFGRNSSGRFITPSDLGLRTAIDGIVNKYSSSIRVYNLSLGSNTPITDYEFSNIAKLIDFLSKEHKVLFVIAAGNINSMLGDFPVGHFANINSRIGSPAESLLGLTVGSIAKYDNDFSLVEKGNASPFSRKGPGADKGIKPEIVAHGGNLVTPYKLAPRVSAYGITKDGKNLAVDIGTSYSAPIISQYAQRLFDMYPASDPNLVKALLCHFSAPRNIHDDLTDSPLYYTGFGEPNIEKAIRAGNFNAAYIYEGQIDQDHYQYISFHIPSALAPDNPKSKLKVRITITYDPQVNPDNVIEYSCARISAKLFKRTDSEMKAINVSGEDSYNLAWNPIIQFEKSFTRSYESGAWDLRLRLYTRGNVDEDYLQDYSVVIEVLDENQTTDVYANIENEFTEIYEKIQINIAA